MSKYPFFGKRGRPSKAEREICKKITDLIDVGSVSQSELDAIVETEGTPTTQDELETLYAFLTGEDVSASDTGSTTESEYVDYEETADVNEPEVETETQGGGGSGLGGDAVDFDPFGEPVIERGYTQGFNNQTEEREGVEFEEQDFEQPENLGDSVAEEVGGGAETNEEGDIPNTEFTNEEEDIPEPQWTNTVQDVDFEESSEEEEMDDYEESDKLGGDNLEDLTPAQKRKSAEKTAEAILDMYCRFAPMPFKQWATIKEKKVQQMVFNNEINPKMQIENGVTVQDYIDGVNEQVEEIFEVDDDTRESIKDPLIDVLMEQELALTPTQRLLMAVGSHVVTMGFSAFQLAQNNKQALETFKQFHEDVKGRSGGGASQPSQSSQSTRRSQPVYTEELNDNDREAVEEIIREMNKDDDGVIDPEHDPSVTVEEVNED